jgi:hypothetical protein
VGIGAVLAVWEVELTSDAMCRVMDAKRAFYVLAGSPFSISWYERAVYQSRYTAPARLTA